MKNQLNGLKNFLLGQKQPKTVDVPKKVENNIFPVDYQSNLDILFKSKKVEQYVGGILQPSKNMDKSGILPEIDQIFGAILSSANMIETNGVYLVDLNSSKELVLTKAETLEEQKLHFIDDSMNPGTNITLIQFGPEIEDTLEYNVCFYKDA